jgi:hypothetical protein
MYLGIDTHKRYSQVAVVDDDGNLQDEIRLPNDSLSDLAEQYADNEAAIEASGHYRPIYEMLDEMVERIINDVFEVGKKAIDRVSGRRSIEATAQPDQRLLEFSRDRTSAVDVLVVAVEKASEEFWWLMNSCSPPASGDEHVVLQQKLEEEILKQRYCLGRRDIQDVVDRSYVLQGLGVVGHNSHALQPRT